MTEQFLKTAAKLDREYEGREKEARNYIRLFAEFWINPRISFPPRFIQLKPSSETSLILNGFGIELLVQHEIEVSEEGIHGELAAYLSGYTDPATKMPLEVYRCEVHDTRHGGGYGCKLGNDAELVKDVPFPFNFVELAFSAVLKRRIRISAAPNVVNLGYRVVDTTKREPAPPS